MRRVALLFGLMLLLAIPGPVRAQSEVAFESLTIELWPDFDQPAVLVLYELVLSRETPLPAQVNIRMPAGAQLFALAKAESDELMNVEHAPPTQEGNYSVVSFVVSDRLTYRVEFYVPYIQREQQRAFIYAWPGDYKVSSFTMLLQEPLAAANLLTDPEMTGKITRDDGLTYRSLTVQNLEAGERLALKVSYDNPRGELSAARPQASSSLEPSQPFIPLLPWFLGGLGLALILGGGAWYWLSGRSSSETGRARKRHASQAEEEPAASAYCSQCGKRAQPSDRFCRACGTKLRQ